MEIEIIDGVKTIWNSGKEKTLQNIANLLFKMYCDKRRAVNVVEEVETLAAPGEKPSAC